MEKQKPTLGGQALIEGVLIRSPNYVSIAVRTPNKKIQTKLIKKPSPSVQYKKWFGIRGVLTLIDTLGIGIRGLNYAAEKASGEKITKKEAGFSVLFAILLAVGLFIVLPLVIGRLLTDDPFLLNLIDGLVRILLFILYVLVIAQFKDIKRTFEYHGAEHMTIACFESGKKLTTKNIRKFSPIHERCGTAFLFIVLILALLTFSFIDSSSWIMKFLIRIIFLPIIAGLSYEILRFSAKHPAWFIFKVFVIPGLWFQKITTASPSNDQIEVARAAVLLALSKETIKNRHS